MRHIYYVIITILISSCSASKSSSDEYRCNKYYKNNYVEILNKKFETISSSNDTVIFNEVRYQCVYSAFFTSKVMYDKFGKWDQAIFPENSRHPVLLWNDVSLFADSKKYDVFTFGEESFKHIYASVMVFDQENKDLFAEESEEKAKLTAYFGELLRNQDSEKKSFYEVYWKTVDPKFWEKHHD